MSASPEAVPVLRERLAALQARLGFAATSHSGKALTHAIATLPHDIAFRLDASTMSGKLRARGFDGLELSRNQKTVTANFRADDKTPLVSLRSTSGNIELQSSGLALASNEE